MSSRRVLLVFCAAFFASADQAGAQWALDTEANLFYTDDVSLFSAARWLDVTAGYHYERGLADGRNQPQAKDDVSYINHYWALGLMIKPMEDHAIFLGADYEHNIFTSTIVGDERRDGKEDIYQWELEYRRTLGPRAVFTAGFQRSVRVSDIPARSVPDNNTWLGLEYTF